MMTVEVATWIAVNALGVVFALWDLYDGVLDLRIIRLTMEDGSPESVEAFHAAVSQAARLVTLSVLLGIGLLAASESLTAGWFRGAMFTVAGVVTMDAVRARRHRKRLVEAIHRQSSGRL